MKFDFPRSIQSDAPIKMFQSGKPLQADIVRVGQIWEMDGEGRNRPLRFRIRTMVIYSHIEEGVQVWRSNVGKPRKSDPLLYKAPTPLVWCEEQARVGKWQLVKQSPAHPMPGIGIRNHVERLIIRRIELKYGNRRPVNLVLEHPYYIPGYGGHADTVDLRDYHEQLTLGQLFYDPQPDRNLVAEDAFLNQMVKEGEKSLAQHQEVCVCGHRYSSHSLVHGRCDYCFCESFASADSDLEAEDFADPFQFLNS